ncbi:hypothetical protein ACFWR9_00535 [Streptomyces sp. NPDC058534]|uniref:hypothetical protein n=1 Tax=Streptomyces sp. NPDC058534 TaxID=3346541 RepID=UPI003647950B
MTQAGVDFESRRWDDQSYSQIQFRGCHIGSTYSLPDNVDVQMWRDITALPDDSYDNKTFSACFKGQTSNGEWNDLPGSTVSVYFQIMKLGGSTSSGPYIDVDNVSVDTTKAD